MQNRDANLSRRRPAAAQPLLHIVHTSPFAKDDFASCVAHAAAGDVILLIEDGVYAALAAGAARQPLEAALASGRVAALQADVAARGLDGRIAPQVERVDYGGFVDLVAQHERILSWL